MRAWLRRRLDLVCGPTPLVPGTWWFGHTDRQTILRALQDGINYRQHGDCTSCKRSWPCPDAPVDAAWADSYGALRRRIQGHPRRPWNRLSRLRTLGLLEDAMSRTETTQTARETR